MLDAPVSILVCTRDRRDMLDRLLADLRAQNYAGNMQTVVVEETDDPRLPPGVDYVPHPVRNLGIAFARNLALEHASHDLVVFVDDDCRVARGWLQSLVTPLDDLQVLGVQGGVTVPKGTNAIGWAETLLGFPGGGVTRIHHSGGRIQETREVSTLNAAYRKQALLDAGGFDAAARLGGEDYLLAKKVARQGRLLFVPSALVRHAARGSIPAIWRWFMRRGTAEIDLWWHGLAADGFGGWLIRSSVGLKLLCVLLLWPWFEFWPVALLLIVYVMLAWWRMRWCLHGRVTGCVVPWAAFAVVPAVKLCMDLAADAGRLNRLLKGDNG